MTRTETFSWLSDVLRTHCDIVKEKL